MPVRPEDKIRCSFCGKSQEQVRKMIAGTGNNVFICDECIELCSEILEEELGPEGEEAPDFAGINLLKPKEIKEFLDQYVVGQEEAKKVLSVSVYNHYKRITSQRESDIELQKSNILMLGPTGSGKTYLAQTLAKLLNVPFAIADATTLTEAGYVGEDVENILLKLIQAADNDVSRAEYGIVYIDEIDKITKKSENVSQQELIPIDTTNILFICGGAFDGLERIVESRMEASTIGFGAKIADRKHMDVGALLKQAMPQDLTKFGLIPEFVGRVPVMVSLDLLDEDALVKILTEPKNAITKQYQKLFELDDVKLEFTPEAVHSIAHMAVERKTGARGLRSIMENVMMDMMYEIPSDSNVGICTVTSDAVEGKGKPEIVYRDLTVPRKNLLGRSKKDSKGEIA